MDNVNLNDSPIIAQIYNNDRTAYFFFFFCLYMHIHMPFFHFCFVFVFKRISHKERVCKAIISEPLNIYTKQYPLDFKEIAAPLS